MGRGKVWCKYKGWPMAWGPVRSAGNHEAVNFSVDGTGADASRVLRRKFHEFKVNGDIPADASGAYRPNPQAKT